MEILKNIVVAVLLLLGGLWLWESGRIADFADMFKIPDETAQISQKSAIETPAARSVRDILERQKALIQDIEFARSLGDRDAIIAAYNEIFQLEQSYQSQYEQFESEMSSAEITALANSHQRLMKSLPSFTESMNME